FVCTVQIQALSYLSRARVRLCYVNDACLFAFSDVPDAPIRTCSKTQGDFPMQILSTYHFVCTVQIQALSDLSRACARLCYVNDACLFSFSDVPDTPIRTCSK